MPAAAASAQILRLPSGRTFKLDDGPRTVALVQSEIWASKKSFIDLADIAGIAPSTVGNIASGATKHPRLATIVRLLMVLGWSVVATKD